ncbi:class I SAM-dependent methyltransferase [Cerasibacillus sp. JNUCC 74]
MDEKEKVRLAFAKNKQAYISSSTHRKKSDLKLIEAWLQPTTTMRLLNIATGGGHVAKHLSSSVAKVYATDLTKEMLENTKKHLQSFKNFEYLIADAEQLPFLDHSFELITCRIAAHHFPHPELFIPHVRCRKTPTSRALS